MPKFQLSDLLGRTKAEQILELAPINAELESMSAQERVRWALENLQGEFALSSKLWYSGGGDVAPGDTGKAGHPGYPD